MMQALFDHIARFVRLTDEERQLLADTLQEKEFRRKSFLLKEGQVCHTRIFVVKGCLRMYYVSEKGAEQIVYFGIDNWWLSDYKSYASGLPSAYNIQTVGNTEVILWDKSREEQLLQRIPALERYFRILMQHNVAAAQQRVKYMFEYSGAERYHHFSTSFPDFVQKIPQYMLASYLGFSAEFLSKIRAGKIG